MQRRNDHTHSTLPGLVASACACLSFWLCSGNAHAAQPYTSLKEIRERGVVMQQWENSCAAATLATVLTYGFRDPVTEHFVAAEMIDKSDPAKVRAQGGFSLLDMKRFAESRGYLARAYRDLSFNDLKAFKAPIVPISNYGYNHYVVFNGVQGDDVLLADPAFGNRKMRMNDFNEAWIEGMAFVVSGRGKDD